MVIIRFEITKVMNNIVSLFNNIKTEIKSKNKHNITDNEIKRWFEFVTQSHFSKMYIENSQLSEEEVTLLKEICVRRLNHYPLQYITNMVHFYNINLYVDENVLIPRSETEIMVDSIIKHSAKNSIYRILDIGTGSGNILCAVIKNTKGIHGVGTDISSKSLYVAKQNINELGISSHIDLVQTDMVSGIKLDMFDIVAVNPPYIPEHELDTICDNELKYEPERALLTEDKYGLQYIEQILNSWLYLESKPDIIVEIGYNQKDILLEKYRKEFNEFGIRFIKDYNGYNRFIVSFDCADVKSANTDFGLIAQM